MEIQLTQGKIARIDDEDRGLIEPYRWYAARFAAGWYAQAAPSGGGRGRAKVKLHNLILGCRWVDHIDGDGLNNTRKNLRPCDNPQNQQNTGSRGGSSKYKGVSWISGRERWHVAFRCDGRYHFVGNFTDEIEAAKAYDSAIMPLAGEFARLNFPTAA